MPADDDETWSYIAGLREDLGYAESRIAELEDGLAGAVTDIKTLASQLTLLYTLQQSGPRIVHTRNRKENSK